MTEMSFFYVNRVLNNVYRYIFVDKRYSTIYNVVEVKEMEKSNKLVKTLYIITNVLFFIMIVTGVIILLALITTTFIDITAPSMIPDIVTIGQTLTIETGSLVGKDINSLVGTALAVGTLSISFLVYLLFILRQILRNVKNNQVFIESNVNKIKLLSYSLIMWAFVSSLGQFFLTNAFINAIDVGAGQLSTSFNLDLQTIFFGLIILLLSEIFSHGVHLQNEYDATV